MGASRESPRPAKVAGSATAKMITRPEVNARRSAMPPGTGVESMSTTRKRRRVMLAPVLLTNRRLIDRVPLAPFGTGVRSRNRFGTTELALVASSSKVAMVLLRSIGEARFYGPVAPRCWPAIVGVAAVSAKMKSVALFRFFCASCSQSCVSLWLCL